MWELHVREGDLERIWSTCLPGTCSYGALHNHDNNLYNLILLLCTIDVHTPFRIRAQRATIMFKNWILPIATAFHQMTDNYDSKARIILFKVLKNNMMT